MGSARHRPSSQFFLFIWSQFATTTMRLASRYPRAITTSTSVRFHTAFAPLPKSAIVGPGPISQPSAARNFNGLLDLTCTTLLRAETSKPMCKQHSVQDFRSQKIERFMVQAPCCVWPNLLLQSILTSYASQLHLPQRLA
jgi:hypothetical protein